MSVKICLYILVSLMTGCLAALNNAVFCQDVIKMQRGICKSFWIGQASVVKNEHENKQRLSSNKPFLTIHGNVQYDYAKRSFIDTPFSQKDFQQHTVQTVLNIVIKDRYPVRLVLSNRRSNSPYFKNFLDLNMQFDHAAYMRSAKQRLMKEVPKQVFERFAIPDLEKNIELELTRFNKLRGFLKKPDVMQLLIEERERIYYAKKQLRLPDVPEKSYDIKGLGEWAPSKIPFKFKPAINKSLPDMGSYTNYIAQKQRELDSLQQKVRGLQKKLDSTKSVANQKVSTIKQSIYRATDLSQLNEIRDKYEIDATEKKEKLDNFLIHVKSFGIGRSFVNYSDLTANNVSLTGLNIEYNNKIYTALAVGKMDYGFRDFFGKNSRQRDQYLILGRVGIGDKNKKAVILSAFTGKKYSYGSMVSDTVHSAVQISGYSIEGIWKKNEFTGISAELAKTTTPVSGSAGNSSAFKNLVRFSDNSNMGLVVKGQTRIIETGTSLAGYYRRTGRSFQSFSLFSYNTDQTAWSFKVDQSAWKDKLAITAILRRNDFVNPFTEKTFKTSTVFKTFQLTARIPKWPVISAGYFPGSQLYVVDKQRVRENAYYMLNGSVVHHYSLAGMRMLSSAMYNRYSSRATDSGFIAYRGINYTASHSLLFGRSQLQGVYVYTDQEQMQFYTLEANGEYLPFTFLRIGAGVKYNKVANGSSYWGNTGNMRMDLKKFGTLMLQYEKSYLPTIHQTLFPVEIGRASWFKNF